MSQRILPEKAAYTMVPKTIQTTTVKTGHAKWLKAIIPAAMAISIPNHATMATIKIPRASNVFMPTYGTRVCQ